MNKILIFREKHGNRYFDASTNEKINAACFKILKDRFECDEYEWLNSEEPEPDNLLSEEQIESLPTENLKSAERKRKKDFETKHKHWEIEKIQFNNIKNCVESGVPSTLAYSLLRQRSIGGGQYEDFDTETLEEA